jgi:ribonuclease J
MTKTKKKESKKLKIIPLGGMHEVGKNMMLFEYGEDIMIIDCGMTFPTTDMLGIDCVIPDFEYLRQNSDRIRGMVLTHSHEDHIGGVPFFLKEFNVPIYASPLTQGFLKIKFKEHKITDYEFHDLKPGSIVDLGCFKIEALHVTHSVADSMALLINTPAGKVFHTGDFKFDYTPLDDQPTDIARIAQIGREGVHLLLSDSTNAVREGFSESEKVIKENLEIIFKKNDHRLIITTFSSNVHRVQSVLDLAYDNGRKVAITGRSMENMVKVASELGYLKVPPNTIITLKQAKLYKNKELVILTTGSQGEPMSALTRIAEGQHKDIKITSDDVVILSSSVVPGNELGVYDIINEIMAKGAQVIYSEVADVHASGHAKREELKLMLALLRPKYFMPVHGEIRLLISHKELAQEMGISPSNIVIAENGSVIELTKRSFKLSDERVQAGPVLVDGLGIGDVGSKVLGERKALSEGGLIVLCAVFDGSNRIVSDIQLHTKGLIYVKEYGEVLDRARAAMYNALDDAYAKKASKDKIKEILETTLKNYIYKEIKRNPVIVPVFMEV